MELQNKYLAIFYNNEPNCVYSFEVWYFGDYDYCEDIVILTICCKT
ncbi:MAG: hypothetical protein ACI4GY_00665 [Acutalibacteraceae bacterium]